MFFLIALFLIFVPLVLSVGVFTMWFVPNPEMKIPALFISAIYCGVIFAFFEKQSGNERLRINIKLMFQNFSNLTLSIAGIIILLGSAYASIYVTCAGLWTSLAGEEVKKEFTVDEFYDPYEHRYCRYRLVLKEISPVPSEYFCIKSEELLQIDSPLKGDKVVLSGKESVWGFHIVRISKLNKKAERQGAGS